MYIAVVWKQRNGFPARNLANYREQYIDVQSKRERGCVKQFETRKIDYGALGSTACLARNGWLLLHKIAL
jgi:hypothetical protein